MNKLYIYILFIILGLCIYLYINKKEKFNIGGQPNQIELICKSNSDDIMSQLLSWIDRLVYKETIIPCYDIPCNELPNYNISFRFQYWNKHIMLIENDIYRVINPILNSDYVRLTETGEINNLKYTKTFNFNELDIRNEIDSMIKNVLNYFHDKQIIKQILNNEEIYNNIFTSDCLSTSKIHLVIEDTTKLFGLNTQYNEQLPKFSSKCNNFLKKSSFIRPRGDNEYNHWHQDVPEVGSLTNPESYPYYFNCIITPSELRKGPLYRYAQEDCLYMDTQVSTNVTEQITNKTTLTRLSPYTTIEELNNNIQDSDDLDEIDFQGFATSNYEGTNIITQNSKTLREHYITGVMFDNLKLFHARGSFVNTNGIILNDKDKQSYINIYKDESSQVNEWISTIISPTNDKEKILNFKNEFKKFCASDFLTLPTFNSFCRRIIRITLVFKET
mgnify:CR=1 FL=1|jgi:hypothetical protein